MFMLLHQFIDTVVLVKSVYAFRVKPHHSSTFGGARSETAHATASIDDK